ncbi:gliding motility-associated C-terminal domain-containing protein [Flavobacterium sp. SUN052]|uniref:T9SS type B sorting domain-containing protein n=1 Tax=Flavobacterium sp. SUN052 TaxID=3002441 RepID=UPI00237DA041|nr:gliding motility-associated C-terminal domain-containing protein [Flavobacterium sp. SUN052]MEC4004955.1 gliding motility-associated C-terminal domain-containing protein [Flavobacterium sp. SUN052]
MKALYSFLIFLLSINFAAAQCGNSIFCNANTGVYSNDTAADIAYDNMSSGFHTTCIKEPSGNWKVWGEYVANDGFSNVLSPIDFDVTNYPALTGTIYKMVIGSNFGQTIQLIVLTSDGLFVLGTEGAVISDDITTSTTFQKITINGKTDGLPTNISPVDVKMMFATSYSLMLTTCSGEVYVLSQDEFMRGDGGVGSALEWSKVMQNASTPLNNVVVARGNSKVGFALKANGSLWTWGYQTFLGDGSFSLSRSFAEQMVLPSGLTGIKMIQCTNDFFTTSVDNTISYYILGTDKKIYSLGTNNKGQLGDRTSIDRFVWVNAKNPDNSIISDAAWISCNEHDENLSSLAVIKTNGVLYTCGNNSYYMIGRTNGGANIDGDINYLDLPTGISATDFITYAEAGGHTCALIKRCTAKYGYVGHRIRGSIGDGSDVIETIPSYDFISPPAIAVCGAQYTVPTIVTSNASICSGQTAIFTITGAIGDVVSYTINGSSNQSVTIGPSGSAQVTVVGATSNQTITLIKITDTNATCSYDLLISATVIIIQPIPVFAQVPPICERQIINPLLSTSINGIEGVWSPAFNNLQTTTYTFTPLSSCASAVQMTVVVTPTNVPTFNQVAPICENTPLSDLPLISINGYNGSWSPALNNLQTTTYTFTPTPISGVCIDYSYMTIVVNPKITPTFTQISPICEGSILTNLPTTSNNGVQGSWSPAMNNLQTTVYTFTPTSSFCTNSAQMTIVVNPKVTPVFPVFPTLCYGDTLFNLPLISSNGISGSWSPALNNTATTTYTFTPNSSECAYNASVLIPVYSDFDFDLTTICSNHDFIIETNTSSNNLEYTWQINTVNVYSGINFNLSAYLNSTPTVESFPITITVTAKSTSNCFKTKSITINSVFCDIPNVITPNNDNFNDSFDLTLLNPKNLIIYNRWGVKVYEKQNYLNEWHGQNSKEKSLPDGVYFYVIDLQTGDSKAGWVLVKF